jgi:hypothetical protein
VTDDRLSQSDATERIPARRSRTNSRPPAIPVRRGQAGPVRRTDDPADALTEELPVMSDEEFEAIQAAAVRRARGEPEPDEAQEPTGQPEAAPERAKPRRRSLLGGLTGALTAATVIVALLAIAAQVFSSLLAKPGPGLVDVIGQAALGLAAILAQRGVDRRRGARRGASAVLVLLFAAASFGVFWVAWLWLFWRV